MPLTKLQFRPGINRETTSYTNEGGWFDGDKVRFRAGLPEKIGGWQRVFRESFLGSARSLHSWRALDGTQFIGVGTSKKFYINEGGAYQDITPIRSLNGPSESTTIFVNGVVGTSSVSSVVASTTDATGVVGTSGLGSVSVLIDGVSSETVAVTGLLATAVLSDATSAANESVFGVSDVSFSATDGSDVITVLHPSHGAVPGDFVTFSRAESLGGNITADVLNQEYEIQEILSFASYTIRAREPSTLQSITTDGVLFPTYVTANSSDTSSGGNIVTAAYQISVGLNTSVTGSGWGSGTWSRRTWGSPADLTIITDVLRLWGQDNFGEDLIFNVRDGGIYYWDRTSSDDFPFTRAVELSSLNASLGAPTIAKQVLVSDVDRHVIAFGCDPVDNIGTQDPLLIRFSDQENPQDWVPTATNTAGDLVLGTGSEIVAVVETRQQILVLTDKSAHAMQYVGPPFTFGVTMISENISVMSQNSAIAVDDTVFWMGKEEFYIYNGTVQKLPCTVKDFVFSDLNLTQGAKVCAATNSAFSEVWWFYPSASSEDIDRYVVFDYAQNVWHYGTLGRTAWIDRGLTDYPIAAALDGHLYFQDIGFDDGSTSPASAIDAYIESSQIDIGDGEQFAFVRRIIPDLTFRNSESSTPSVTFTLKARNFPGGNYLQDDDSSITKSTSVSVEQYTQQAFVRLRGRSIALRVSSDDTGVGWRLGSSRIDIRPDGRR